MPSLPSSFQPFALLSICITRQKYCTKHLHSFVTILFVRVFPPFILLRSSGLEKISQCLDNNEVEEYSRSLFTHEEEAAAMVSEAEETIEAVGKDEAVLPQLKSTSKYIGHAPDTC